MDEIEAVGKTYRYLLVEYAGFYRNPKPRDYVYWKNLLKYCEENALDYTILMIAHFEFHKKMYNSHPYPNMLYSYQSLDRYQKYVEELLKRYPDGEIPLRALFKSFSIVQEVENDCYKIKLIAVHRGLSKVDAALAIFHELSPYIKLLEPKLTRILKLMKPSKLTDCRGAHKLLLKNKGLKSLLIEVLQREFYGRSISLRSNLPAENLGIVPKGT